ncbi:MAG TPA: type II CAAX endopeptidase family protein [Ornithinimicrobium sp.]|uniref:CPBP family intramembrane glutamic endopeptidase n=1 Tax=Ornithinimicrobium sp. TaxID=1977084 RepID=UPI002B488BC9|nr:type II CAAX endopeptidase family protein [Ornithinimicrobium sp.]HKJ11547.1 type II CAAX endopeptidase family protein [Ornithinimicrobium sp.]
MTAPPPGQEPDTEQDMLPDRPSNSPKELLRFLRAALVTPVPRDHSQTDAQFRRRRIVVLCTLFAGSFLLGYGLTREPGDISFYIATAALAGVWTVGAFASGPLHLGWAHTRMGERHARPVLQPFLLGVFAVTVFCLGAVIVAQFAFLRDPVNDVLDYARAAPIALVASITLINGLAEELFFRGAAFAAIGRKHPVEISTALYGLVTISTGNLMLVFAAVVLGTMVGLQRRVTGGVLGPIITHLVWSMSMLFILPPLLMALTPMS